MSDFVKEIHAMFDHIWDCEIDHPVFQDTVGELMEAVIQAYEKHKPTLSTNLAEVGTECISRQAAIDIIEDFPHGDVWNVESMEEMIDRIKQLQPIQPVNCSEFPNNSDTISRKAAIDALKNDMASLDHIIKGMSAMDVRLDAYVSQRNQVVYDIDAIEQLPPIQSKLLQPWEVLVAQAVLSQPTAAKRGKWIEDKGQQTLMQNFIEKGEVWRVCSVCGAGHMIGHKYECDKAYHETHHNFCPNCGAKMEVNNESN